MKEIQRRDFEESIKEGVVVIVCFVRRDSYCEKCINDLTEFAPTYPYVKYYKYDVQFDVDINEQYDISQVPTILIFKNNILTQKIPYQGIKIFQEKLDLKPYDPSTTFSYKLNY